MGTRQWLNRLRKPQKTPSTVGVDQWDYSRPILALSDIDWFLVENSFANVAIFGELGDGKSTGSVARFLIEYMKLGMGGLICCVKPGDRELIEQYARMTGRTNSLIIVSPENRWRCNLLRYAFNRPGIKGSRIEAVTGFLTNVLEAMERGEKGKGARDPFWER